MSKKIKEETVKISMRVPKSRLELLMKEYGTDKITDVIKKLMDEKINNQFQAPAVRSVITGIGGKNKLAQKLIALMPPHTSYIEPFGRTASVLLQKDPVAYEVYNDIDEEVTNFFLVLRSQPDALYSACRSLPYSEVIYRRFVDHPLPDTSLERAVRFFFLNRSGYLGRESGSFRADIRNRNYSRFYYQEVSRFFAIAKRFENVEILNRDFRKAIRPQADNPDAFFFVDPPYFDGTQYYEHRFEWRHHRLLAELLATVKGKAMVCLSYHANTHRLYAQLGFRFEVLETYYAPASTRNEAGELARPRAQLYVYMNYDDPTKETI